MCSDAFPQASAASTISAANDITVPRPLTKRQGTTLWPSRPTCNCLCGCRRRPRRRIRCPRCNMYVGPGCCWDIDHMCHFCWPWGLPEPQPETPTPRLNISTTTETTHGGNVQSTPDRREVATQPSEERKHITQVFPGSNKGKRRQMNRKGPEGVNKACSNC